LIQRDSAERVYLSRLWSSAAGASTRRDFQTGLFSCGPCWWRKAGSNDGGS